MSNANVKLFFGSYQLPHVYHIEDPKEGIKATVIEGNRADGSIVIPGGKRSQEIRVRGNLYDSRGYEELTALMDELRDSVTTEVTTLTLKHGVTPQTTDWTYTVRRIGEISFPESLRLTRQEYEIRFLVISY